MTVVLAVDGGNSKTDLALVGEDGRLLAFARGPQSSPHHLGEDGCMPVLAWLVEEAGLDGRVASVATLCMAGGDFPREEERLAELVRQRGWARNTTVLNDTFAVLRAGTGRLGRRRRLRRRDQLRRRLRLHARKLDVLASAHGSRQIGDRAAQETRPEVEPEDERSLGATSLPGRW